MSTSWISSEIRPLPSEAPSGVSPSVVRRIRERLGTLSAVLAGGLVLPLALHVLFQSLLGWELDTPHDLLRVSLGILALVCGGATFALRSSKLPEEAVLPLCIALQLLGALLLSLPGYWGDRLLQHNLGRLPWVALWIVIFPLVVPLPTLRAAVVAVVSASLPPVIFATWVVATQDATSPPIDVWVCTFLPTYLAAAIALAPAHLVHQVTSQAAQAESRAKLLGSYKLVERLGRGGMGEVWRAEHILLARPAAIKLIAREFLLEEQLEGEDQTVTARFEREAKVTASLASPNTVALYDYGTTSDGNLFYVMELLYGTDLDTLLAKFGPVPAQRAVHILAQVCQSLAEAHGCGLIHRDIKPANVYLCRLGSTFDVVKVLDFGLVGLTQSRQRQEQATKLTAEGYIVGTPSFMAPEMARGEELDHRADLYAVGCLGYWLLTGQLVFERNTPVSTLVAHTKEAPDPPSRRLGKPIPPELEDLILKCLEKDPAHRPASAEALADALLTLDLEDPWTTLKARAWWHEHADDLSSAHPTHPPVSPFQTTENVPIP